MTRILNLVDHLLDDGQRKLSMGRTLDGVRVLTRLTALRDLPESVAEIAQSRLAQVHLRNRRFRRARRHLTAALVANPNHAEHHYLLARACQGNGQGDLVRAAEHFRLALEIEPDHIKALIHGGILAVRTGQVKQGLTDLRRALELAPDDAHVLEKCVRGLKRAGKTDEARAILRAALFRNSRRPDIRKLWDDFQFQQLRRQQEEDRLRREGAKTAKEGPHLLPFMRVTSAEDAPMVGHKGPATLPGPHRPRLASRTSRPSLR